MRAGNTGTSTINPISSNPSSHFSTAAQARPSESSAVPLQWLPILLALLRILHMRAPPPRLGGVLSHAKKNKHQTVVSEQSEGDRTNAQTVRKAGEKGPVLVFAWYLPREAFP